MKKIFGTVTVLLACFAFLAGCGGGKEAAGADAAQSDTLIWALPFEPPNCDPAYSYDFTGNQLTNQITEPLLYFGPDGQVKPLLVSGWEQKDATTYVYNVRSDVKFSDGTPMTMEDVLYSLERYRDAGVAAYVAWMYDNVDAITKTGDWQFTVKLKGPDVGWKEIFATSAGHIVNKAFVEKWGDKFGTPEAGSLGTGPYKIAKWEVGSQITLDYNEDYWNKGEGVPDFKHIVFQIIPEDTTRAMAITSGQVDFITTTPIEMLDTIRANKDLRVVSIPSGGFWHFDFNTKKPYLSDPHVRRAICYAFDSIALQKTVIKDLGPPTNYLLTSEPLFGTEKAAWTEYEQKHAHDYDFSLEKAKAELAQSKYPNGFECTISCDSKSISNSVALFLQEAMAQIGIKATILKLSNEENVSHAFGGSMDANGVRPYDIELFEWGVDFLDVGSVYAALLLSSGDVEGGSNCSGYRNPEFDALVAKQSTVQDPAERAKVLMQCQDILLRDMPIYPYCHNDWIFVANNRIASGPDQMSAIYFWDTFVKNFKLKK